MPSSIDSDSKWDSSGSFSNDLRSEFSKKFSVLWLLPFLVIDALYQSICFSNSLIILSRRSHSSHLRLSWFFWDFGVWWLSTSEIVFTLEFTWCSRAATLFFSSFSSLLKSFSFFVHICDNFLISSAWADSSFMIFCSRLKICASFSWFCFVRLVICLYCSPLCCSSKLSPRENLNLLSLSLEFDLLEPLIRELSNILTVSCFRFQSGFENLLIAFFYAFSLLIQSN